MYYGSIKKNDVANGPGVRVNLFVSGCTHCCEKCFNEDTWNFQYGELFTNTQLNEIIESMNYSYISGITFLGGEPMEVSNRGEVLRIAKKLHELYPDKTIWCYTGYLAEELLALAGLWSPNLIPSVEQVPRNRIPDCSAPADDASDLRQLLELIDVLVDGEFVNSKRNLMLRFCGSENQRLIDLKKTIANGTITIWK